MSQDSRQQNKDFAILGKMVRPQSLYLGIGIILVVVFFVMAGEMPLLIFLSLLSVAVRHPIIYLLSIAILFIISIIGILRSDKNDNKKMFYTSAFLFCFSIVSGILYFIVPAIFWFLFAGD